MEISVEKINKYITLDNQIHELELKNTRKKFEDLQRRLITLQEQNKSLKADLAKKSKKMEAEKADVDNLSKAMEQTVLAKGKDGYKEEMQKEEAEYLEALAAQETTHKFLTQNEDEIKMIEEKTAQAKIEFEKLDKLCQEHEENINSIFKGSYGSTLENKLEADLDMYLGKQRLIGIAHYKWTNGRVLLKHSYSQLSMATKTWEKMKTVPFSDTNKRYQEATKVRNNLIAAILNITNTHSYLDKIKFPYLSIQEIQTLQKATDNIYADMTNQDRVEHAYKCYDTTLQRCDALLQWFEKVINDTIEMDMKLNKEQVEETQKHLRAERMRLMKELADQHQIAFDVDQSEPKKDDQEQGMQGLDVKPAGDLEQENTSAPVQRKIADLPSQDQIFGDMEMIKKMHDERIDEYQKVVNLNKARVDQGLEEKLAERRQKRKMQEAS
ncbi:uncharacterized protein LOC117315358 isoform X2 [Pecten maximus]|uniref:uncharacterized protein LOC117315358 isoform X2 n=1 Tax=Pecten maximus TaxID=6579 RepID=UPI0014586A31|nr:uncharacterized protein LOC117315358 isoform X2 [Pecten maximus]